MKYTKKADNENFDIESPDNIWTVDMFMDNMDSPDGHDNVEFTKIGLIDFINGELDEYGENFGESWHNYQLANDVTNAELEEAVNNLIGGKVISIEPYRRIQGSNRKKILNPDYFRKNSNMRFHKYSADKRLPSTAEDCCRAIINRTITKEDGELYDKVLEKAIRGSDSAWIAYELLSRGIITRSDGIIFNKAVKKAIEESQYAYFALRDKMITKEDGIMFKKAVETATIDLEHAYYLIRDKVITEEDGEIFDKVLEKLGGAINLLKKKLIKRSDGDIFNTLLEKAIEDSGNNYDLLRAKIVTRSDGEIFNEVAEKAIEDSESAAELLYYKIITKEDGEIFNKAVEKALKGSNYAYWLLKAKIVTKSDGEIFKEAVEKALKKSRIACLVISDRILTKEDGEIFNKAVEKATEDSYNAHDLLSRRIITKSDGKIFNEIIEKAIEDSWYAYDLLSNKKITRSDVSPELWEDVLVSAEGYDSSVRQKFGSKDFRRNSNMRFYRTAGWKVEKVNENDWIIHTPKGYYVDENDKEYHFSTKEKALAELDYLRAEHKYEKKSELGFNANPENEEEERVLEIANELENACFNAYKENKWNGWSTLEERQRGIDLAKKALAPLVEKYDKELSDDRFFKMLYRHNEDNNYHTENKALEELTGRKRRASMNRKAYYDEYLEDLNSPEYIYSLLLNGNIAEYKKALNDMTKKELVQYLHWADEMDIDDSKLNLHYITASKKVTAEKYNPIARKKFASRGYILRKSYKNNEIVPGVKHIWNGAYSDPEIEYNGYLFNYWDVLDALETGYNEICEDNNEKPTDDGLDTFIKDNIKRELDDYINIGGIGKKIESSNNRRTNMKYFNNTNKKIAMRKKAGESYDDEEYTVSAETIQYYKENGGVLKGTPEYNEFFNAGYTMKQSLTDKDKYYVVEMERMRPFTARRKKAGESYGWVVDSADAYDALDKFVDAYGTEEALDAITRAMSNDDLSDTLAYIFREYDFKEGCSDYEEDEEYEEEEEYKDKEDEEYKKEEEEE